ncbi:hypothetical protein GGR95_002845 [Sulfitobacter undariae]|uniref:Uncharacterized protein n=1 Tax=Sulfitobacter undariae TaxID=1563671 RepID=A0A7W6H1W9_9RHOB|nr:hypothetical protein [Sulfitobacter undariae]MBB3995193.1 hypothetical protein [Sulfitobacter undariae]
MPKTIFLGNGSTADAVLDRHGRWASKLNEQDARRLRNDVTDLVTHGKLLSDHGASFKSKRTVELTDAQVVLDARFGAVNLWDRLLLKLRA